MARPVLKLPSAFAVRAHGHLDASRQGRAFARWVAHGTHGLQLAGRKYRHTPANILVQGMWMEHEHTSVNPRGRNALTRACGTLAALSMTPNAAVDEEKAQVDAPLEVA